MSTGPVFPQIDYAESGGALRACYDDMKAVLRVPWVMFAARSLAVFGGFVPAAWQTARPSFTTPAVERAADELRAMAILPGDAPPDPRPGSRRSGSERTGSPRSAAHSTRSTTATPNTCC